MKKSLDFENDIATVAMKNTIKVSDLCEEPHYLKPSGPRLPTFPISKEKDYNSFKGWYDVNKKFLRIRHILDISVWKVLRINFLI